MKVWISSDESFDITTTGYARRVHCLHVQPGVIDFPARCVDRPDHFGPHRSASARVSHLDDRHLPITYWENTP